MKFLADRIIKYRILVFTLFFAATLAFSLQLPRLQVVFDLGRLMLFNDNDLMFRKWTQKTFNSRGIIFLGIKGTGLFTPDGLRYIQNLTESIEKIPGVNRVQSITNVSCVTGKDNVLESSPLMEKIPETAEEMADFKTRLREHPLVSGNILSQDLQMSALNTYVRFDDTYIEIEVYHRIKDILQNAPPPEGLSLHLAGTHAIKVEIQSLILKDLMRLLPLVIIWITIIYFLNLRWAVGKHYKLGPGSVIGQLLIPVTGIIICMIWTFGLMALLKVPINILSSLVSVMIFAVGSAYFIYFLHHYYKITMVINDPREAVSYTFTGTWKPISLAALTTMAGFLSLVFTPLRAIREFGLFSAFSVFCIALFVLILLPAVLSLVTFRHTREQKKESVATITKDRFTEDIRRFAHLIVHQRKRIIFLSIVLIPLCIGGISRLKIDNNLVLFLKEKSPVRKDFVTFQSHLPGVAYLDLVIKGTEPDTFTKTEILEKVGKAGNIYAFKSAR